MNGSIRERIIKNGKDAKGKTKTELKVYDIYYRYKDLQSGQWKQTSKKGFRRRGDAENFLVDVQGKLRDNTFIPTSNILTEVFLREWLMIHVEPNLAVTTVEGYKYLVEKHIIPKLGKIPLQELTTVHIQKFYSEKQRAGRLNGQGGLSPKSILYIHRVFSEAIDYAVKQRILSRNVVKEASRPRVHKYRAQVFDKNEIQNLLTAIKDSDLQLPVSIAVLCGMRRGEILGLRWCDVDFKNKSLTVRNQLVATSKGPLMTSPKTEDSNRVINAPDEVIDLLKEQWKKQEEYKLQFGKDYKDYNLVNCMPDGDMIAPRSLTTHFYRLLKQNGLKHIRFHDLRHSCASLMLSIGVPLKVTSTILGHSTVAITADIYGHVLDESKKDASNKVSNAIFGNEKVNEAQAEYSVAVDGY